MFLNPTFFKKRIFKSFAKHYYKKIIKQLENKGIVVYNIKEATDELKRRHKNTIKFKKTLLSFDDYPFPITNTLYIHLFNNQYYNENIYNKKKVEVEREMLFLLAGKLGVKTIKYETEVIETTISNINAEMKIKGIGPSIKFNKSINKTTGSKGFEEYLNRGAPVYLKSDNLQEVEKNIEDRMGLMQSNIFNYNFYKHSPKLESFVYKRYEFKMQTLDYTIETEDLSDISFAVRACFMNYGLEISFDKNTCYSENIHYMLEFFTDIELKKEFGKMKRDYMDKFYSVRELYDLMEDKDKAVHLIAEYVMELANNYHYKSNNNIYNFGKELQEFIINSSPGVFESLCHEFHSTSQIKNWIKRYFLKENMEIIESNNTNNDKINIEEINNGSKLVEQEKIELDRFKRKEKNRIEDLQRKLELLSKNEECISQKSSDLEINKLIENCNASNIVHKLSSNEDDYYEKNFYVSEERFANNLATCINDDYNTYIEPNSVPLTPVSIDYNRPPIIPSSSVSSVFEQDVMPSSPYLSLPPPPPPPHPSLELSTENSSSDNETNI